MKPLHLFLWRKFEKHLLPATFLKDFPAGAGVAEEYFRLLQHSWFDSIDGGDLVSASEVLHEHAEIKHYRVWTGDQNQAEPFELISGKSNILLWLQQQRTRLIASGRKHLVKTVLVGNHEFSFRAETIAGQQQSACFIGWIKLRDQLIYRYTVVPD